MPFLAKSADYAQTGNTDNKASLYARHKSVVEGYISAIMHMIHSANTPVPATMNLTISETPGLVWSYYFAGNGEPAQSLKDNASIGKLPETGFYWFHFKQSDARLEGFLEGLDYLPEDARSALIAHETHPSLNIDEGYIYGTLADYQRHFTHQTRELGFLNFAITDQFIITTRLQPLSGVGEVRKVIKSHPEKFESPMDVYEQLVTDFQRSLFTIIREITAEMNEIEDAVYGRNPMKYQKMLQPLRLAIVRIHRHLRTLLTALRHVYTINEENAPKGFDDIAQRIINKLEATGHEIDALQDRARLLHEEINTTVSNQTNQQLFILSVMTALLLPPTLVTGFFGMNTAGMPFEQDSTGTIWAIGAIITSIVVAWIFLKRGGVL